MQDHGVVAHHIPPLPPRVAVRLPPVMRSRHSDAVQSQRAVQLGPTSWGWRRMSTGTGPDVGSAQHTACSQLSDG